MTTASTSSWDGACVELDSGVTRLKESFRDQGGEWLTGVERRVELHQRVRPEKALGQLQVDQLRDSTIANGDEALDVLAVLPDHLVAQLEDVHGFGTEGMVGVTFRCWAH